MNEDLFAELLDSVREGGRILRAQAPPSRSYRFGAPDVRQIRSEFGLSQSRFASLLGISVATLRNWEQGRRTPEGPARVLLQVATRNPKAVLEAAREIHSTPDLTK